MKLELNVCKIKFEEKLYIDIKIYCNQFLLSKLNYFYVFICVLNKLKTTLS